MMETQRQSTCHICVSIFQNRAELYEHQSVSHKVKERPSLCELCNKSYTNEQELKRHHVFAHTQNPENGKCFQCEKKFLNHHQLKKHVDRQHMERKFQCEQCKSRLSTRSTLKAHIERQHLKLKNVSCPLCSYTGFSNVDLRIHNINKHSDFKPYKCSLCPMAFSRSSGLYSHQNSHENAQKSVKDHPCSICGKIFTNKRGPASCAKMHNVDGDFKCSFEGCGEKFTNSIKYKSHSTRHTRTLAEQNKVPCNNCDIAFTTKSDLRRHTFYMHEEREKVVSCPKCPKMFISRERLERHLLVHNNTSFECPFEGCDVKRSLKFSLNSHYRQKHGQVNHRKSMAERLAKANEKVSCPYCKKEVKKTSLNVHTATHTKMEAMGCVIEGCFESIHILQSSKRHSYNLPLQFYEHLEKQHDVDLKKQRVCVEFKCKHCNEILYAESLMPQIVRFGDKNARNWSVLMSKHLTTKHARAAQKLDIKNDWKLHYENGIVSLKEMDKEKAISYELKQILDSTECKLCNFVAKKSFPTGRNLMIKHYCQQHFTGPMTEQAERDIKDNFCKRCNKKFSFKSTTHRLLHVGYNHRALYPFLKEDSNIDLSPFVEKELVVDEKQTYSCEDCGKVFSQKGNIKAHMVYHSDERPFPCNLCAKAFKTLRDLNHHTRIHNGQKPYECEICEKTVAQSANLYTHMKVYHTYGSFNCKDCREKFPTKWNLTTHKSKICTTKQILATP